MGKIILPQGLSRKDRINYVVGNSDKMLDFKKSLIVKYSDAFSADAVIVNTIADTAIKSFRSNVDIPSNAIRVKAIANTAMWMDSHSDVLLADCWKKTIKEGKRIKHLKEHKQEFDAEIGKVRELYSQEMTWRQLGVDIEGMTQALVMESDVMESMNAKMYERYKNEEVDQHSIGLRYIKIDLAVDDKNYKKGKDLYDKYIEDIGNKEVVKEQGFFFAVGEIKLYENSAVLFGSNELTPTLEISSTKQEPGITTLEQPPKSLFAKVGSQLNNKQKLKFTK